MKHTLAILFLCSSLAAAAPVRVLVSSDDPAIRADLAMKLNEQGAQAQATAALDPVQLNSVDVVLLHSSEAKPLAPESRAAIEKFTQRGGGLVVLGGAIGAGDWLKPIVGGAWTTQSRKFANRMMLYTLADAHPITREASPFDLDDETFYDLDTDPAIHVLASAFTPKVTAKKIDSRSPERLDRANVYDLQPQMWTCESADGHRAFVLLQSQPETLKHASIRTFLLRGISWAAKRENVDELCAKEDLATLRYPKDGPRIASDTVRQFDLQPGFKASAIASEPLINKPIAMQWDARGRLWIAETPEYPNGRRPLVTEPWKETGVLKPGDYDRPATDRISILEDTNGDGVLDKKTVFHQGLELITGFCLYGDGVIAVGQPDIVFIHDEGAQQKVERLYTGFTPGDTHFVANHFMVAPDGWIYANTGSGPKVESVAHPEVKAQLSSGVFRFKPDGSAIEQVGSKGGNAFGLDITSDGELFFGQATSGNPVQHVVLPEAVLAKGKVGTAGSVESVIKGRKVVRADMPDRAPFMQIDVVGGYSAACASTVYEAGAWPAEWNRGVFCTEPILDIIHHEKLVASGPTFTGEMVRTDAEWLRSHDYWFFPVDVQFGPDGAMYVLDFYCPIVAHSDSRGPQHSKAGASIRPDRDHYFGRIYRIQHEQAQKLDVPDLSKADAPALVRAFTHPNKWVRFTAQRLLMNRADAVSVTPALTAMAEGEKSAPARILALWSLQRLGKLSPQTRLVALKADDANVRKCALLVDEDAASDPAASAALLGDPDPRVRLTALRVLASSKLTPETAAALLAVLPKLDDDWSKSAAVASTSSSPGPVLEAALAMPGAPADAMRELASSLAAILSDRQDSEALAKVIVAAAKASPEAAPLAEAVLEAASLHLPPAPTAVVPALQMLLASKNVTLSASALPFAVAWDKDGALRALAAERINTLLTLAADASQSDTTRTVAARSLVRARAGDARIIPAVLELLKTKLSDGLLVDIIRALAATNDTALGQPLVVILPNLPTTGQTALYDALTNRADWANAVLDALEAKQFPASLLGPARLSRLRLHPDSASAKRALKIIDALGGGTNAAKDEVIAKLRSEIDSRPGDATKGHATFTTVCAVCHKLNGEGKEVGPVLDGIGVHGTNELLIHIIDPSRVVDNEHRTWALALKNGTFANGIIGRENERALTLRLPGGIEQEIKLADIKSRQDTGLSLMPEGFEALGADTLRDLFTFLAGGSAKYRAINLSRSFTTDTDSGLYHSREAKNDTVRPVKYGVVTVQGVPFSLPDPSTTPTGGNVIVLKSSDAVEHDFAATLPQSVEIPVGFAAGNLHFLGGVAGWGGGPDSHKPAMKVTIEHTDGAKQVVELFTGDVFIDYPSGFDVPGSKRAEGVVKRHHVRFFSLPVEHRTPIAKLVLESYKNGVGATTLAITADNDAPVPRKIFSAGAAERADFKPQTNSGR